MGEAARVSAVVLAYGRQPLLGRVVDSLLTSTGVDVDVVLVDNGGTGGDPAALEELARTPGVRLVTPGRNTGFAAGSNLGAGVADGEYVAFVNGDVLVRPDALAALVATLTRPDGPVAGLATASVRLLDEPDLINSAGNPVHFLGLSWAGGLNHPASDYAATRPVAAASGATTVIRRDQFLEVGGFCETLFTYVEDTDLSLRVWQRGWSVTYVPAAVVLHDYEFGRNPGKFYLLERNRLFMVMTVFPARLLALVAPALIAFEMAALAVSLRDGWSREKVRGWWWLVRHPRVVKRRRREVTSARVLGDKEFAALLTSTFDPGVEGVGVPRLLQRLLDVYWRVARRLL
jgi:GT2 family glycosyltransferase